MHGVPRSGVGVVCNPQRFDDIRRIASEAGIPLAWMEPSLKGAEPRARFADSILVEWLCVPNLSAALIGLLTAARRTPIVLVGEPPRADLFELGRAGLAGYAEEFTAAAFLEALAVTRFSPEQQLRDAARANLGRMGVKDGQRLVRTEMFREALLTEKGNRHAAARVLRVDRRYVLKMAKESPRDGQVELGRPASGGDCAGGM